MYSITYLKVSMSLVLIANATSSSFYPSSSSSPLLRGRELVVTPSSFHHHGIGHHQNRELLFGNIIKDIGNAIDEHIVEPFVEPFVETIEDIATDTYKDVVDGGKCRASTWDNIGDFGECVLDVGEAAATNIYEQTIEELYEAIARAIVGPIEETLIQMSSIFEPIVESVADFADFARAVAEGDELTAFAKIFNVLETMRGDARRRRQLADCDNEPDHMDCSFNPMLAALEAFKDDGAGSVVFTFGASAAFGVGGEVSAGAAVNIGMLITIFENLFTEYTVEDLYKEHPQEAIFSIFFTVGGSIGFQGGADVDCSIGYHTSGPEGIGGPAIDLGLGASLKVGAAIGLGFDASPLADLRQPQLNFASISVQFGASFEINGGGSYSTVLTKLCLKNHDDKDVVFMFDSPDGLVGNLIELIEGTEPDSKCPELTFEGVTYKARPLDVAECMECVQNYAQAGQCDWDNWAGISTECNANNAMDSSKRASLVDQVKAGQCTSNNFNTMRSEIEMLKAPLFSGLECVEGVVEFDDCTPENWDYIYGECALYNRMDESRAEVLRLGIENGECTRENWNKLQAKVIALSYPLRNTLDCVGTYAQNGSCNLAHWNDMNAECGSFGDGNDILGVFRPRIEAGLCTRENWSSFYYGFVQEDPSVPIDAIPTSPAGYNLLGERQKCSPNGSWPGDFKLLDWNAGTTAACAEMVEQDSYCSDFFMVKRSSNNVEDGTECRCVKNGQTCSLEWGGSWNAFSLN